MKRFFCIFGAMLIVIANVNAQSDLSRVTYDSGAYYIGEVNAKHKPHGKGTYYFADGSIYEGDWVNDELTGKGAMIEEDGSRYIGDVVNGKPHGKGTSYSITGTSMMIIEGEWRDGKPQIEEAKIEFKNAEIINGEKKYPNGDHYVGEMNVHGEPHGKGVLTKANGDKYEGNMVNGRPHGLNTMTSSDGTISVGKFIHGYRHGQFTAYFPNGSRLECEFRHNDIEGKGKITDKNGNVSYRDF